VLSHLAGLQHHRCNPIHPLHHHKRRHPLQSWSHQPLRHRYLTQAANWRRISVKSTWPISAGRLWSEGFSHLHLLLRIGWLDLCTLGRRALWIRLFVGFDSWQSPISYLWMAHYHGQVRTEGFQEPIHRASGYADDDWSFQEPCILTFHRTYCVSLHTFDHRCPYPFRFHRSSRSHKSWARCHHWRGDFPASNRDE